ncbi:hypothetical protein [Parasitella parasitica]|uniref:Uncharacterized protein n=1 Tax=Parasitella parasitica TaxID=35722 RepID=A0A0B7MMT4_9FUNG|nr:hypothetical protein [Parasitella parasitica]
MNTYSTNNTINRETEPVSSVKVLNTAMPEEFPASFIQMFKDKFPALESLELKYTIEESQTEEQGVFWWNEMTSLCQSLQKYSITIVSPNDENYLLQLKNYVNFLRNIVRAERRELSIRLDISDDLTLEIEHNGSKVQLVELGIVQSSNYIENLLKEIFESVIIPFPPRQLDVTYKEKKAAPKFRGWRILFSRKQSKLSINAKIAHHMHSLWDNDITFSRCSSSEIMDADGSSCEWSFEI